MIEVSGRVLWDYDDEPVAKDRNLSVVFVANGVAHLPIRVAEAVPGEGRVRKFSGRVYLNASDPKAPGRTRACRRRAALSCWLPSRRSAFTTGRRSCRRSISSTASSRPST